ncbi:MAG: glutathione S-transferase family protein [Gammaproteobacteria bacterium]|nr:glutathione S-transferase family protein [Gammaproteobacteria bacterium]MBQ0840706.1 glutathione S-transferase family protein [Gammaproteobacteria bacterium]
MKLYEYNAFANPRRVRIFAAEKGIQLKREQVDVLAGEHLQTEHLQRNPYGAVPTLELDDGTYISESAAICRYLEGLKPANVNSENKLLGSTPKEQVLIEMWDRRVENGLLSAVASFFHHGTEGLATDKYRNNEWGQHNKTQIATEMKRLDEQLRDNNYIAGNTFSMADITALCAIDFAALLNIPISDEHSALQGWYGLVSSRASAAA